MNIVIVGHVDHGKSTLIGRLLYDTGSLPVGKIEEIRETCKALGHRLEFAYIADALEEERKREMTIDTTQTFFRSKKRSYAIIDAPGHRQFLKNMVTGASQADAAVLIVDVRGMGKQTKRHAYLLKLLGISQVVVVVNKMDLVRYERERFGRTRAEVLGYLRSIDLEVRCVIPISAYRGDNVVRASKKMGWHRHSLIETLDSLRERKVYRHFRMPVQDFYQIGGGRVYVGNVISGQVRKGQRVRVHPGDREVQVERILVLGRELQSARKPRSVGVILKPDPAVDRGAVVWAGAQPRVVNEVETAIFAAEGVRSGRYLFCCSTQETPCRVEVKARIDTLNLKRRVADRLRRNEIGEVKMWLDESVVAERFEDLPELGRFVLKRVERIVAGGIIR
jgi:sulfate adenylyltransferase subunit 1 (EFTu-like GTPase family)